MKDKRIIYYVFTATADENQNSIYHKHGGYLSLGLAKKLADRLAINQLNDFIVLERHFEKLNSYGKWELDYDITDCMQVVEQY